MQSTQDAVRTLGPLTASMLDALVRLGRVRLVVSAPGVLLDRCFAFGEREHRGDRIVIAEPGRCLVLPDAARGQVLALVPRRVEGRGGTIRALGPDGIAAWEAHVPPRAAARFRALVDAHATPGPAPMAYAPPAPALAERPNDDIDVAGLRAAWDASGAADPVRLLAARFALPPGQMLRLLGDARAERVPSSAAHALLVHAEESQRQVGVRLETPGCRCSSVLRPMAVRAERGWLAARGPCALLQLQLDPSLVAWSVAHADGRLAIELLAADGTRRCSLMLAPRPASIDSTEDH